MPNSTLTKVTKHHFALTYDLPKQYNVPNDDSTLRGRLETLFYVMVEVKPELEDVTRVWHTVNGLLPTKPIYKGKDIAYLVGWVRALLSFIDIEGVDAGEVKIHHKSGHQVAELSLNITITHTEG